jgi:hypothetical protein
MSDDHETGAAKRAVAQGIDSRAKAIIEEERVARVENMARLRAARLEREAAAAKKSELKKDKAKPLKKKR